MVRATRTIKWLISPVGVTFFERIILFNLKLRVILFYLKLRVIKSSKSKKPPQITSPITIKTPDNFKVKIYDGFQLLVFTGNYEPQNTKLLKLKEDSIILDVGANYGFYTLFCAAKTPKGKIISIEAEPDMFKYLVENVNLNDYSNIQCLNYAVWNTDDHEIPIYKSQNGFPNAGCFGSGDKFSLVKTRTLDRIVTEYKLEIIDWLKIDVEQAEVHVLEGAKDALSITKNVLIEIHTKEIGLKCEKILKNAGFAITILSRTKQGIYYVYAKK